MPQILLTPHVCETLKRIQNCKIMRIPSATFVKLREDFIFPEFKAAIHDFSRESFSNIFLKKNSTPLHPVLKYIIHRGWLSCSRPVSSQGLVETLPSFLTVLSISVINNFYICLHIYKEPPPKPCKLDSFILHIYILSISEETW